MPTGFRAIPIKKQFLDAAAFRREAITYLREFDAAVQREFSQDYGRVAESPRYRRTGTYGRGWRSPGQLRFGTDYSLTRTNPVRYAVYVGGPKTGAKGARQARAMARRGWSSITDVVKRVEKEQNRRFRKRLFGSRS